MTMKRNILHTLWAAAAVLLTACTQEELPLPSTSDSAPLSITVTDGGYTSADGSQKTVTRATDNGYRTDFTAGDECGLYIVRNGKAIYENVKLTATKGEGGKFTWQPAAGTKLTGGSAGEQYFLYYPYQADMTGKTTVSATDAEGFFTTLVSGWQPETDQSTYAKYTASDLMTATGTIATGTDGKRQISFAMTHRMALAVIELNQTVYHFTNTTGGTIPDYVLGPKVDFSGGAKPYRNSDGTYRYLVNPSKSGPSLTGSYDGGKKEFTISTRYTTAGKYTTYRVDGAKTVTKNHKLQIGDYLLADGSLVSKDETLTEAQKASVSAIVFWTPSETTAEGRETPASLTDDKIMSAAHPNCKHGLAVAVKALTYNGSKIMVWQSRDSYDQVKVWQDGQDEYKPSTTDFVSVSSNTNATDNINRIYGYQNTVVLRAYNAYCLTAAGNKNSIVQPVAALDQFVNSNACPAPANSTGWFLPSAKELYMLCYKDVDHVYAQWGPNKTDTRGIVNKSLVAVGGHALMDGEYWSSSESKEDSEYVSEYVIIVDFSRGEACGRLKDDCYSARAVCAF